MTLFEKIIAREIPASIVYEDEHTLAFLDINPNAKGHTLVIPKEPCRNIFDASPETLGYMMATAKKVAAALRASIGAEGINIGMNNEAPAGQEVFHAHIHVIPRTTGDNVYAPAHHTSYADGEMKTLAAQLSEDISAS